MNNEYNGWTNWETWNIKLWLDEVGYRPWEGGPSGDGIREYVEETYGRNIENGPLQDAWGMYLSSINWAEVYGAYVNEDYDDE